VNGHLTGRNWLGIVALALVVSAGAPVSGHGAETPDETASAEQGRALFDSFGCYQCHGHYGQGGVAGPKLAPMTHAFEVFNVLVRTPPRNMPPYTENVLTNEQLQLIHAYLQSLEKGTPATEIPLLNEPES